jgi:hypothetical protein
VRAVQGSLGRNNRDLHAQYQVYSLQGAGTTLILFLREDPEYHQLRSAQTGELPHPAPPYRP